MSSYIIKGGNKLEGTVRISGSKNASLPIIAATILNKGTTTLYNIPNIQDTQMMYEIIKLLGGKVQKKKNKVIINTSNINKYEIPDTLMHKMRSSVIIVGAIIGRYKTATFTYPGGCEIGSRPIDLHLKAFEKLGIHINQNYGNITCNAEKIIGNKIDFDFPSVGATENAILASILAEGKTTITNAAREPEIIDLQNFLNKMGAKIKGAGTNVITITGVDYLHKSFHEVIPDRIEAGTYVIIGALLGENLTIKNLIPSHIESLTSKLIEAGVEMNISEDSITIEKRGKYKAVSIKTLPYPGFPTDLQQPLIPFLTQCHGISTVEETIWENRFQNVYDTNRMGANIIVKDNRIAKIKGVTKLTGKNVTATDLRGGASMLICGLIAEGITTIDNVKYILRGYDDICGKLSKVGAKIELI